MWGSSQRLPPAHLSGGFNVTDCDSVPGAGGETRTLMRSEPRQILSLVRIPISPLRLLRGRFWTASGHIRETGAYRQLEPAAYGCSPRIPLNPQNLGLLVVKKLVGHAAGHIVQSSCQSFDWRYSASEASESTPEPARPLRSCPQRVVAPHFNRIHVAGTAQAPPFNCRRRTRRS